MNQILLASTRALRSLIRRDIFWHLIWPTVAALALWGLVAVLYWSAAVTVVLDTLQGLPMVGNWVAESGLAPVLVSITLLMLLVPLVYVTASVLVAVLALPFMLDRLAATDYRDLEMRHGGSLLGSVLNALVAVLLFLCVLVLSLPLWLIPGLGVAVSVLLSAWLNLRCYRYDALMNHADALELRRIARDRRGGMYALAIATALLAFVPLLNLLVPALTGLVFVHYLLEALRTERARPMKTI